MLAGSNYRHELEADIGCLCMPNSPLVVSPQSGRHGWANRFAGDIGSKF
jgi:hypothetical protein